jgi:hypothetical protein
MKVVRLSASRTGRLYFKEIFLVLISVKRLSRPLGHSATGRIMSMKNSSDTIRNGSRDLSVCSAVPQPLRQRVLRTHFNDDVNSCLSYTSISPYASLSWCLLKYRQLFHLRTCLRTMTRLEALRVDTKIYGNVTKVV